jgi:hypothetical protein
LPRLRLVTDLFTVDPRPYVHAYADEPHLRTGSGGGFVVMVIGAVGTWGVIRPREGE